MAIEPIKGFYVHDEVTDTDGVSKISFSGVEYTANEEIEKTLGGYITTNVSVGTSVNTTPVSSSAWAYIIKECAAGDKFTITGKGGGGPRLWAFTDGTYNLVSKSSSDLTVTDLVLTATQNGYLIVNFQLNIQNSIYEIVPKTLDDKFNEIETQLIVPIPNECSWTEGGYINSNVSVGATVDLTPTDNYNYCYSVVPVSAGDVFVLTGRGGNAGRAWAFTDESYKLLSKSASEITVNNLELTASADGYLIVNANLNNPYTHSLNKKSWLTIQEKFDAVDEEIEQLETDNEELNENISTLENLLIYNEPLVKFNIEHELKNVSSLVSLIDYSSPDTLLFQVYDLFDGLVTDYSDFVTRYDAALYDGLSMTYPAYANGVSEGNPSYLPTQAYKTYMYKFSSVNLGAGNARNCKKKKLFIVCGTHGSENASPFNAYIFAKLLCDANDENYFKLRDAFDVYIVPWLDGYCAQHTTTNPRVNANGVNINRNYPVAAWTKMNEGTTNYTGPSAGSEFETQLVMALTEKIKPDIAIDHHNYFDLDEQFYTIIGNPKHLNLVYQSLADCSFTFIDNLPQYFGTQYQLFVPNSDTENSPNRAAGTNGTACRWWYENGVPIEATLEIGSSIRFNNGSPVGHDSSDRIDPYGETTFSVGEYTLRNQLLIYGQWALGYVQQ